MYMHMLKENEFTNFLKCTIYNSNSDVNRFEIGSSDKANGCFTVKISDIDLLKIW